MCLPTSCSAAEADLPSFKPELGGSIVLFVDVFGKSKQKQRSYIALC